MLETGPDMPSHDFLHYVTEFEGFPAALRRLQVGEDESAIAAGIEFMLEGLHLNRRLNRDRVGGRYRYRG